MSFAAGMGAGMGAGIGTGIAIGVASGKKQATDKIRDYLVSHDMMIHDGQGKEVQIDAVLGEAIPHQEGANSTGVKVALAIALVAGVAMLCAIAYFAFL